MVSKQRHQLAAQNGLKRGASMPKIIWVTGWTYAIIWILIFFYFDVRPHVLEPGSFPIGSCDVFLMSIEIAFGVWLSRGKIIALYGILGTGVVLLIELAFLINDFGFNDIHYTTYMLSTIISACALVGLFNWRYFG